MSNSPKSMAFLSSEKRALLSMLLEEEGLGGSPQQGIPRADRLGPVPVSFAQQRLWFLDQLDPGKAFYNILVSFRLRGPLNMLALERSLSEIVKRHEILRTTFATGDAGRPVQVIAPTQSLTLAATDLSEWPEAEREAETERRAAEEAQRPFDLARGSLLRASLLRLGREEHVLLITMHHVVSDGWSGAIFFRELGALYDAFSEGQPSPLAELPIQYADYAAWQREWLTGRVLEEQLAYWKEQLAGAPALTKLPMDRPRPAVQSFRGASRHWTFPKSLSESLGVLNRREGATLFMTLLAAFQVILMRSSGHADVVVGTDVAGRNRVELEPLIGFFVNQLVMRTDLSGDPGFRELLGRVRETALGAYAHQDVPFDRVVEALRPERSLSYTPLFQAKLVLQNAPEQALELRGLTLSPIEAHTGMVKFDLLLSVWDAEQGLTGTLEYATDLFDAATISRLLRHLEIVLRSAAAQPDARLSALEEILDEADRQEQIARHRELKQAGLQKVRQAKRKVIYAATETENMS